MPRSSLQPLEDLHHLDAGAGVEVAGRLVGEQDRRLGHQRARDRDALLLAARQLVGMMLGRFSRPDRGQRRHRPPPALRRRDAAVVRVQQRQLDVLERRRARQQVEALEHEADLRLRTPPARRATAATRRGRRAGTGRWSGDPGSRGCA